MSIDIHTRHGNLPRPVLKHKKGPDYASEHSVTCQKETNKQTKTSRLETSALHT